MEDKVLKYSGLNLEQLAGELGYACSHNRLDDVKYLLQTTSLSVNHSTFFGSACATNSLLIIDYLLGKISSIYTLEKGYLKACRNGHVEVVKKVLDSMSENCDITSLTLSGLEWGIAHLNVVQYLFDRYNPKLAESTGNYLFRKAMNGQFEDVLQYLILEANVAYTNEIKELLQREVVDSPMQWLAVLNNKLKDDLSAMFKRRDAYNQLNSNLENKTKSLSKIKI